jgi:hypothetical protein
MLHIACIIYSINKTSFAITQGCNKKGDKMKSQHTHSFFPIIDRDWELIKNNFNNKSILAITRAHDGSEMEREHIDEITNNTITFTCGCVLKRMDIQSFTVHIDIEDKVSVYYVIRLVKNPSFERKPFCIISSEVARKVFFTI